MCYNRDMQELLAVIPAYQPDRRLVDLVRKLSESFDGFIVVDDGSSASSTAVFQEVARLDRVALLTHSVNRGKGAALKTAFREALRRWPDACGVVTLDADGQHLAEDVVRVADALRRQPDRMALGVRTFNGRTPFRSRLGNLWTIAEFRLLTGVTVHDTQSGLRGLPTDLLRTLVELPGDRYDFEIRMLVAAARSGKGILEIPIATVYEADNATSHFRPLADTLSTQKALFAAAFARRRT